MVTEREVGAWSNLPIPPGDLLLEELGELGMTQQELALRTGRPIQVINEIVRGKKAITHDTALELEKVLGIPAHIWINLEAEYQLSKARLRDHLELEKQEDWLTQFPVFELQKRGWIPKSQDRSQLVKNLLQFLGVASFTAWRQTPEAVLFRITSHSKVSKEALACWLRRGEIEGQAVQTQPYAENQFLTAMDSIRKLTREPPEKFEPFMKAICAQSGVVFLVIQELPKSGANGAARWLTPKKALIQLSIRYKWSDVFWFSVFHESCHILRHRTKDIHIDGIDGDDESEVEANEFAADFLIPRPAWQSFRRQNSLDRSSIERFAQECEIHPGIVVGRLQHEKAIPYSSMNDLRTRFTWVNDDEQSGETRSGAPAP